MTEVPMSLRETTDPAASGGRLRSAFNAAIGGLVRLGAAPRDCCELLVPGRVSGRVTARPVNVLDVGGERYLVAPRGVTQWVRNVRAGGAATLRRGRRREAVLLSEVDDALKPPLLREYLRRWGWQVKGFVDGLSAESSDVELAAAAPRFPVFECRPAHTP
ncbi:MULTISPECIES: nitroreductase [Gordonia]